MKNLIKTRKIVLIITILVAICGFTIKQLSQEKIDITGTWAYKNEPYNKWIFSKKKCVWEYKGNTIETFTWSISEEKSKDGKLTFSTLKLVSIKDTKDFYEYDIVGLSKTNMTLDYLGDMGTKLTYFEKQK